MAVAELRSAAADEWGVSPSTKRLQPRKMISLAGLLEALARLAEFDTEASNSRFGDRGESDDYSPLGQMIQKNRFLSHASGSFLMEDEGAGHELDRLVAALRHNSKERCCPDHRVIEKWWLDRHQQVESHLLRLERQAELLSIDLDIRSFLGALNNGIRPTCIAFSPFTDGLSSAHARREGRWRNGQLRWTPCAPRRRSRCGDGVWIWPLLPLAYRPSPCELGFGTAVTDIFVASPVSIGEDPWKALHEIQLPKRAQSA